MVRTTKEESLKTKQRIVDTAIELFFQNGVSATTLDHIASAAGMTRGAIYHHFKNKLDLVTAIHDDLHLSIQTAIYRDLEDLSLPPLERLRRTTYGLLTDILTDKRKRMVLSIFNFKCDYSGEMASFLERQHRDEGATNDKVVQCFEEAQRSGKVSHMYTPEFYARTHYHYISGVVIDHLRRNDGPYNDKEARQIVDFYFNAISPS